MITFIDELKIKEPLISVLEYDADVRKEYLRKTLAIYHMIEKSKELNKQELHLWKMIRDKINEIWRNYLSGKMNTATSQMQNLLNLRIKESNYAALFTSELALKGNVLYRGRVDKKPLVEVSEFYHIPFHKRYLIRNQRYSLSGIPCLYLGSTKECIFFELNQPQHDLYMCSCKCQQNMRLFDISADYDRLENINRESSLHFLYTLPLRIACSMQVIENENHVFKSNYIIPQLVTVALYNKKTDKDHEVAGICYASIKGKKLAYEDRLNYVFFPKWKGDKDIYDEALLKHFTFEVL